MWFKNRLLVSSVGMEMFDNSTLNVSFGENVIHVVSKSSSLWSAQSAIIKIEYSELSLGFFKLVLSEF